MKKLIAMLLAMVMVLSLAACGGDKKDSGTKLPQETTEPVETTEATEEPTEALSPVEAYVEENREALISSMNESFGATSGMTCTSEVRAEGNGIVIDIRINEMDNLTDEEKAALQQIYDSMGATFGQMLTECRKDLPELEYITMNVCEADGDVAAVIHVDDNTLAAASTVSNVKNYVDENGQELAELMALSFTEGSGLTCETDIWAMGNGIEIAIFINELTGFTDADAQELQAACDTMGVEMMPALEALQEEVPGLAYITVYICDGEGNLAAYFTVDANSGPNESLQVFVDENYDEFLASMDESFATSSGMTCESYMEVIGNGIVVTIYINELEDLTDEQKQTLQSTYDSMGSLFDTMFDEMVAELPELEFFSICVCDVNGDPLAAIVAE